MLWSRSFSIADGQSASGLRCLSKIVSEIINDTFVFISWPCKMESFSNSKGPQSITKKLEDPKGITKGNIDVAAWTHKFSLATRYQRLNCFFGAAIDMSKVKSWTSEATPLANHSFERSYKISLSPLVLCIALWPCQKLGMIHLLPMSQLLLLRHHRHVKSEVMNLGSNTFGNPLIQKVLQNKLCSLVKNWVWF